MPVFVRNSLGSKQPRPPVVVSHRLLPPIKPVIGAMLPLARMGEAHELLENGSARGLRGKVVIDVSGEAGALPTSVRAG